MINKRVLDEKGSYKKTIINAQLNPFIRKVVKKRTQGAKCIGA
jgi:hypothetical protein